MGRINRRISTTSKPNRGSYLDENNVSVRRSTRLASKSSCPSGISDWPLPKILEVLFKSHIPVPTGATHEELFTLLCESIDVPAPQSPPPPQISSKKNMQKRKNLEPASTSATGAPKRACGLSSSARSSHSTIQNNDPVLSTLSSIQSLISNINSRIQALESGSASRISENLLSGPASSNTASTTVTVRLPGAEQQVDDVIPATIPRRTMGSAVPVSTGSTLFSPTAAISHQLRSQIIAGNDVNLVKILLGPEFFFFFSFFFFFGLSVAQITHESTYAWLCYHHSQPFFFFFFF